MSSDIQEISNLKEILCRKKVAAIRKKYYKAEKKVCKGILKNNEGNYDCDFIECGLWDKRAEIFCQYMSKGELVGIEGKLRLEKYTNENGEKISKIKVKVDSFSFIPSSKRKETNNTFSSKDFFTEEIFDNEISENEIPF